MNQPLVLILGARGRFGRAAVDAFAQAGWQVVAQVRPGVAMPGAPGVRWIAAAPQDAQQLALAAKGAQVVVNALSPAYTHRAWRTEVPRLTQAAIAVSRELGALLMLPGSVYNFGAGMPALLHEDTPQRPTTFKGRMRVASEQMIRQATSDGRIKAVVIRGGDFFGSGTGSWFDQVMARDLRAGKFTYPGGQDVPTTWAYLPDMARAFVRVAQQRERLAAFENLHFAGTSLTGADWAELLEQVAREQGWLPSGKLRVATLSWPLMRLLGLVMPTVAALCEMRYLWRTPYTLVDTRMAALVGATPRTPLPEAVRAALADLGLLQAAQGSLAHAPA
ncbi:MAG TPA: NAD-dependent epimerase/dehydratase family protein [Ramlibacter sp.]|jgi:nucleoside-diphosphate-sugar epimerase